jgi:pimeloyl-ACP methyl ester carboxylesterase
LDGEGFTAAKLQEHLSRVQLEVFSYPVGVPLRWDTLAAQVANRVSRTGSGLLIGESFGGAVAQETALRQTSQLHSVMLVSTFSRETEPLASAVGRAATRVLPRSLLRPVSKWLASWKLAGTLEGEDRRKFLERFEALNHVELADRLRLLKGFNTRDRLKNLQLPVEVVYGMRDSIAGVPEQLQTWKQMQDCRVHAIEGYGHLVSAEAAPQVARVIEDWALRHAGGK